MHVFHCRYHHLQNHKGPRPRITQLNNGVHKYSRTLTNLKKFRMNWRVYNRKMVCLRTLTTLKNFLRHWSVDDPKMVDANTNKTWNFPRHWNFWKPRMCSQTLTNFEILWVIEMSASRMAFTNTNNLENFLMDWSARNPKTMFTNTNKLQKLSKAFPRPQNGVMPTLINLKMFLGI